MTEDAEKATRKKNIVTSNDVTGNKSQPKKTIVKKQLEIPDNKTNNGKMIIVFESGSGYVTKSNFKFTQRNKIAELDYEEAKLLLQLDNFRFPTEEEKEQFYASKED